MQTAAVFTENMMWFHLVLSCLRSGRMLCIQHTGFFALCIAGNLHSECINKSVVTLETSPFDKLFVVSFFSSVCFVSDYNK